MKRRLSLNSEDAFDLRIILINAMTRAEQAKELFAGKPESVMHEIADREIRVAARLLAQLNRSAAK
jgi:hypothetical protein